MRTPISDQSDSTTNIGYRSTGGRGFSGQETGSSCRRTGPPARQRSHQRPKRPNASDSGRFGRCSSSSENLQVRRVQYPEQRLKRLNASIYNAHAHTRMSLYTRTLGRFSRFPSYEPILTCDFLNAERATKKFFGRWASVAGLQVAGDRSGATEIDRGRLAHGMPEPLGSRGAQWLGHSGAVGRSPPGQSGPPLPIQAMSGRRPRSAVSSGPGRCCVQPTGRSRGRRGGFEPPAARRRARPSSTPTSHDGRAPPGTPPLCASTPRTGRQRSPTGPARRLAAGRGRRAASTRRASSSCKQQQPQEEQQKVAAGYGRAASNSPAKTPGYFPGFPWPARCSGRRRRTLLCDLMSHEGQEPHSRPGEPWPPARRAGAPPRVQSRFGRSACQLPEP